MPNNDLSNVTDLVKTRAGFQERLPKVRDPALRQPEGQLEREVLGVAYQN